MSLICTGTIGIDTVYTPADHREKILGGSCTYFAAAASFHGPVRIVAAVGGDWPAAHRKMLESFKGVDLAGLETRPTSKTFAWGGKYLGNMDSRETLFTELGVLAERAPAIPEKFRDSAFVFLANTHPAVQLQMLESFPKRRLAVADTMDLWINTAREELDLLLSRVDGLVLNYDEAELLTGKANTVAAAKHVLRMGPKFVVVKKGEHGCLLVSRQGGGGGIAGSIAALPAYPAENVMDPTGAGDTFAGGMMGYLAASAAKAGGPPGADIVPGVSMDHLRRALAHGTVVASFNIESFGLERLTKLTRDEIDRRYEEYARMVRV